MDLVEICRSAQRHGASDIHFKAGLPPMVRIDGSLTPLRGVPPLPKETVAKLAWNLMTPMQREKFKTAQDLDCAFEIPGVARFRVNVFRQRQAVGMVLRTIPTEVKTIDELGMPRVLKQIARIPRGLVLVTGTTGSGKSTTLASLIEEVNRNLPHHILTVEDPIEFTFKDRKSVINQREIGVDSRSFATALKAALRQDPDVILVGELRDLETMEIALQAAETGHLVLSTLHTLDAPETINRIVGFFEPHHQLQVRRVLAGTLQAVLSQRLVPKKGGGRVAAVEIMRNTGTISECIADQSRLKEITDHMAKGSQLYGTQTFDQAIYRLIKHGKVTKEDGFRYANNPDEVQLRLSGLGGEEWD